MENDFSVAAMAVVLYFFYWGMILVYLCSKDNIPCYKTGIKESDTGLAAPSQWDLVSDKQMMQEEQPLQVLAG